MERYLYLSLTPESLISSMLPPHDFGTYMAVGTKKKSRGQAMYFEVDEEMIKDQLPMDVIEKRCVTKKNGTPKRSVYLSVYRVLESLPLEALKNLYLTTNDGRVLELEKEPYDKSKEVEKRLHLYQEITPVTSRIASSLPPSRFLKSLTDNTQYVFVPKLVFVEMDLDGLATDPVKASDDNLPYPNIDHLRDCLIQLKEDPKKIKKTVIRNFQNTFQYRTCINGFFVGAGDELVYFRYPGPDELNLKNHVWWRSANQIIY